MERVINGSPANFEVHFLDSDNPRDGFRIMSMNPPVFYEFRTPIGFLSTHTIVRAGFSTSPLPSCPPPSLSIHRQLTASYGIIIRSRTST